MRIEYSLAALRALRAIPVRDARRIEEKVSLYARDPAALANNVKALQGQHGILRLRVGEYRVLFTADGLVLAVISLGHRREVYR